MQLKEREENVSQGGELRGGWGGGGVGGGGDGGGLGTDATGNTVMLESTEEALTGC